MVRRDAPMSEKAYVKGLAGARSILYAEFYLLKKRGMSKSVGDVFLKLWIGRLYLYILI